MGELNRDEIAEAGAPTMYTPEQASEIMSGGSGKPKPNWFKEKARAGVIPCTRLGRTIMFTPQDLADIARMNRQKAREQAPPAGSSPRKKAGGQGAALLQAEAPRRQRNAA